MKKRLITIMGVMALCMTTAVPVMAEENENSAIAAGAHSEVKEQQEESAEDVVLEEEKEEATTPEDNTQNQIMNDSEDMETVPSDQNIPENGWYTDDIGTYYYVDGEALEDTVYQIEDAWYYFDGNGIMMVNRGTYVSVYQEDYYIDRYCRADEEGKLIVGWYTDEEGTEYYGEDLFRYEYRILTENELQYYFDYDGKLVVNDTIVIEGVVYIADSKGVLSAEKEEFNGWQYRNGKWYYYEDGQLVYGCFKSLNGKTYYFDDNGVMQTGVFWATEYDEETNTWDYGYYLANTSGEVYRKNMWVALDGNWYYVDKDYHAVVDQFCIINGVTYYFDYDGKMKTGRFCVWEYDEELEESVSTYYLAAPSGAVYADNSWHKVENKWVYVQANGQLYTHGKYDINNKTYIFDYDGNMETGIVWYFNEDGGEEYYGTDASGAVVKNNWVKDDFDWYYTDANGVICTGQWINETYYLDDDGRMVVGLQNIDGIFYSFADSGVLIEKMEKKNGWELVDGSWLYWDEHGEPYHGWLNNTYYLYNGLMATNEFVWSPDEEHKLYVDHQGLVIKGWYKTCWDEWLYADANGNLLSDWQKINGKWYYFDEFYYNMCTYPIIDNGILYDIKSDGTYLGAVTGKNQWKQTSDGSWYYFKEDGSFAQDEKKVINGATYYFWSNGVMASDCIIYDEETDERIYINASGIEENNLNGWQKIEGNWYYYKNGVYVTGLQKIGGKEYYFNSSGRMDTGYVWVDEQQKYRFAGSDGALIDVTTGWYSTVTEIGRTKWYYFENGAPANGLKVIGGKTYYFDYDGMMCTGAFYNRGRIHVFDANGALAKNTWVLFGGTWYYADATGCAYTGQRTINGRTYWFTDWGVWVK